jgi:CRP-like cAMP-binding protein
MTRRHAPAEAELEGPAAVDVAVLEMLGANGIFRCLSADGQRRLARLGRRRAFAPGDALMREGEASHCMHVIVRGLVRVDRRQQGAATPLCLAELGPGETVGEMGLLNDAPRSATVTALEDTRTLELDEAALAMLLAEFPEVSAELLRTLSRRLRGTTVLTALRLMHRARAGERAQAEAKAETARLQGVQLAARTMEHHVNSQLTLTLGYSELLAADPRLPGELLERAQLAAKGARDAAATVQKFRRIAEVRPDTSLGAGALLRLD